MKIFVTAPADSHSATGANWVIPAGLIALTIIPMVGGAFRLVQLGGGAEITPENARFFAAPLPVMAHIVSSVSFCVLGAFQFAPGFRRRSQSWHRAAGRTAAAGAQIRQTIWRKRCLADGFR